MHPSGMWKTLQEGGDATYGKRLIRGVLHAGRAWVRESSIFFATLYVRLYVHAYVQYFFFFFSTLSKMLAKWEYVRKKKKKKKKQNRAEQSRAEQSGAEQSGAEQSGAEQIILSALFEKLYHEVFYLFCSLKYVLYATCCRLTISCHSERCWGRRTGAEQAQNSRRTAAEQPQNSSGTATVFLFHMREKSREGTQWENAKTSLPDVVMQLLFSKNRLPTHGSICPALFR
ncbi:hypothetical protein POVWA1_050570 [Plasmodium ovale wallikeri]|uniref:Uncharacterized protein n=1 Tax=Plasmodium ovale wallikeri TaxID=864142 RepID=A0A1A8ZLS1_PLAOA|nr:hypothetical protein POVWA1_050570 [Plasmodium ovale wallikeri]